MARAEGGEGRRSPAARRGLRSRWHQAALDAADQLLVDEANSLLDGPPSPSATWVVDEDRTTRPSRCALIGRRSPSGSITILGDLAQSTTPAGQEDGVPCSTTSRRHPPVRARASTASLRRSPNCHRLPRSVRSSTLRTTPPAHRRDGHRQHQRASRGRGADGAASVGADLASVIADETAQVEHRHPSTGIVAPAETTAIAAALAERGLRGVDGSRTSIVHDVPIFTPEAVKGGVRRGRRGPPHEVRRNARGARLLYVAMTRAVQVLHVVTRRPPGRLGI